MSWSSPTGSTSRPTKRSAGATDADVARLTAQIGALEGRLRFVHLAGHLETKKRLARHQITEYDELRGYGADHGHTE
jgi:hypothetical protein